MLYDNGAVSVDQTFARFGAKSYAINKINTVDVRERQPYGQGLPVLFGVIAFACLMSMLTTGFGANSLIGLLVFAGLTYWAWQRHRIVDYSLYLMTSSAEAQAITLRDAGEIAELREAIETAMARQHERELHVPHDVSMRPAFDAAPLDMAQARPANLRQRLLG